MLKIDFYILPEANSLQRLQFACRLIEKAYRQKHRIYIHTLDEKEAHQLDELLWTYREDSFLPHNLHGEGPTLTPPIQIGVNVTPENHRDIMINLSNTVPDCHTQFARILELVSNETSSQEAARERFRFYRAQGFELNTHKLQTIES